MNFIPVIFGGYVNGYSITRTFYQTYGIQSIICDCVKNISFYSKMCKQITVSDPKYNEDKFIYEMENIGKDLREKNIVPIIITTNDQWLIPLSKHRERLEKYFVYSFSEWNIIEKLTIKKHLYKYCDELNVIYPKTFICSKSEFNEMHLQMKLPILVKPSEVVDFVSLFPNEKRNYIFNTIDELKAFLNDKFTRGYESSFVLQEYVPGGVENLYTITTYSDRKSLKLKGVSIGHKLTQYPKEAGTITSGMTNFDERLIEPSKKLLETCGYYGITNIEYKYDKRDDKYKLIEINPRPGMWNYSSYLSGINLFQMMVDDLVLNKDIEYKEGRKQVLWTVIPKKEVLEGIDNEVKKKEVQKLIKENRVVDPRKNKSDSTKFRINILKNDLKTKFSKLMRR